MRGVSEGALEGEEAGEAVGGEAVGRVAGGLGVAVAPVEALGSEVVDFGVEGDEGVS